ncbi:MAG TPA: ATP-binding cassette domain-containing protein [Fimbriimonas sp.]|nr:ATP-binding cassette domain-containing protein [Fimbriimonas sp.]
MISFENVSIVRGDKRVLDNLSLRIAEHEHVAILGPNGCGKSTLIRALTRELYPFAGQGAVKVCGRDRWIISELRTLLGVVSEEPKGQLLGEPTGLEMAVSGLIGTYGVLVQHEITKEMWEKGREALARVHADHLANQPVETMSTGERRRVFIARALAPQPKALVLDEPTSGLDMKAAYEFHQAMSHLARSGVSLVLVTHHLQEIVPEIERVIMMKEGQIFADGPRKENLTPEKIAELFEIGEERLLDDVAHQLA